MLPSGELTSKNDENGSCLLSSIKKPATKNLFSLKFDTGSCFLKSILAELHPRAKRARGRSPIGKEMW